MPKLIVSSFSPSSITQRDPAAMSWLETHVSTFWTTSGIHVLSAEAAILLLSPAQLRKIFIGFGTSSLLSAPYMSGLENGTPPTGPLPPIEGLERGTRG